MKTNLRWLFPFLISGLILTIMYSPIPIPPYLDFQALYHVNLGVLHGIPFYDWTGQINMIAELAGVSPSRVILNPFAYPPWYGLVTLPLALFPIQVAARLWFALNLLCVILFVWLVTEEWPASKKLLSLFLTLLFLPVLGTLFVGQFVFPVLLGAGLLLYALPRERVFLASIALSLLTFKPHIGGLVFLAISVYLLSRRDIFAKRVLWNTGSIMLFFFVFSFFVDWAWPIHYLEKLIVFRDASQCEGLCINIPMITLSLINVSSKYAVWVAGILLLALVCWYIGSRPNIWKDPDALVAAGFCFTLLVSPYQYNYDFVVLLGPFFVLAPRIQKPMDWAWLAAAYISPWIGLFFGRQGNPILLLSAFILTVVLWRHACLLDSDPSDMYNDENFLREE